MNSSTKKRPLSVAEDLPLHRFLTYRISRLQARLTAQGTRLLSELSDLTLNEWRILSLVGTYPGQTSTDIANISELDKGLLSRKLKGLISKGLVQGVADRRDLRALRLHLTTEGEKTRQRILPVMRARQAEITSGLSPEELDMFFSCLDSIEARIQRR